MWKAGLAGALLCAATLAATLTLRDGRRVTGTVVRMDDTNVVLQTAAGQQTYPWRTVSNESIKQTNPALYERLAARVQERQRQAQMPTQTVERFVVRPRDGAGAAGGQLLAGVRLGVYITKRRGDPPEGPLEGRAKDYQSRWDGLHAHYYHGELTLLLDGLNARHVYNVRTETIMHLHSTITGGPGGTRREDLNIKNVSNKCVSNAPSARVTIISASYSAGRFMSPVGPITTKSTVRYWDIRVWIDGALVYEEKDDKAPVFYHVTKK